MAPRIQTDYHSAEETNRYSLRILKHGEKNVSQLKHVSASNISRKQDFFRYLGLQMKRYQCPFPTLHGVQDNIKDRSHSNGLKLRNCSVVVLGATCSICGKCFKCETDVNVHVTLKHSGQTGTVSTTRKHKQDNSEVCQSVSKYYKCTDKNSATKLQGKLRLICRIGDEIVVNTTVKRKHLIWNKTISMATQTEPADATELIIENNTCTGDVPGIDHSVFDNRPCECCTTTMRVANVTNQYIAGNFVQNNPIECEEITMCNEICRNDWLASTCEPSIFQSNSIPCKPNEVITNIKENNLISHMDTQIITSPLRNNSTTNTETPVSIDPLLVTGKKSENSRDTESLKSPSNPTKQIVDSVTVTFQSHSKDSSGSEKLGDSCTEKLLQTPGGVNMVQLVMPVIVPIIVSHQTSSRTVPNQYSSSSMQVQDPKTCFDEQISDDEVQEVLRIVRGHDNVAREINHESPNRFEQEMLARDVIKDMLRMEQQGWHLIGRDDVETSKKRRRSSMKFDTRNGFVDEIAKKKIKSVTSENDFEKTMTTERNISKESFAKIQKSSHDKLSISENAKDSVLKCNGTYTDGCEINNNTETTIQEPVDCHFILRSAVIENISNRPTLIDLVHDTDE